MRLPCLLLCTALILLSACARPASEPTAGIHVQVTSTPGPSALFLDGRALGATPRTLEVPSLDALLQLTATAGDEELVERRIRFLALDQAEVTFTFGAGASATARALGLARVLVFDYGAGVTFDVDRAELKPSFMPLLDRQADLLDRHFPGLDIHVCGHTDAQGSQEHNLALSLARAQSVAAALANRGVARARMKLQGFGSTYPLASNQQESGRAQNRRTELVLPQ
jgi:outer membrane protein OmpA-like peptidoglycan-associated protein